jgi:hypothetical protein
MSAGVGGERCGEFAPAVFELPQLEDIIEQHATAVSDLAIRQSPAVHAVIDYWTGYPEDFRGLFRRQLD